MNPAPNDVDPTMTKRALYLATVLLGCIGCSSSSASPPPPLRFDEANVFIAFERDGGRVTIRAEPEYEHDACPRPVEVAVSINGTDIGLHSAGGGYRESGQLMCDGLFVWEPFDTGTTDIEIGFEAEQDDAGVASWHVAAEWSAIATKVWSDDSIYRAGKAGEPFTVRWSPEDARAPQIVASSVSLTDLSSEEIPLEELERAPGLLRYRFAGELPLIFRVLARDSERPTPSRCEGFDKCTVEVRSSFELIEIKVGAP
jgi:hypothetical protein